MYKFYKKGNNLTKEKIERNDIKCQEEIIEKIIILKD